MENYHNLNIITFSFEKKIEISNIILQQYVKDTIVLNLIFTTVYNTWF